MSQAAAWKPDPRSYSVSTVVALRPGKDPDQYLSSVAEKIVVALSDDDGFMAVMELCVSVDVKPVTPSHPAHATHDLVFRAAASSVRPAGARVELKATAMEVNQLSRFQGNLTVDSGVRTVTVGSRGDGASDESDWLASKTFRMTEGRNTARTSSPTFKVNLRFQQVNIVSSAKCLDDLDSILVGLQAARDNPLLHDFELRCVGGRSFPCSRFVLGSRSEVFLAMLSHDMKEKAEGAMEVGDTTPEALEVFIQLLYTGRSEDLDQHAREVYDLCHVYQVSSAKETCLRSLEANLSPSNAAERAILAHRNEEVEFEYAVLEYVIEHLDEVQQTPEWSIIERDHGEIVTKLLVMNVDGGEFGQYKTSCVPS